MNALERLRLPPPILTTVFDLILNEAILFPDSDFTIEYDFSYIKRLDTEIGIEAHGDPLNEHIGTVDGYCRDWNKKRVGLILQSAEYFYDDDFISCLNMSLEETSGSSIFYIPEDYKIEVINNFEHIKIFVPGKREYFLLSCYEC